MKRLALGFLIACSGKAIPISPGPDPAPIGKPSDPAAVRVVDAPPAPTGKPRTDPDGDGKANTPVPLVLLVHGGPWARDSWGLASDVARKNLLDAV